MIDLIEQLALRNWYSVDVEECGNEVLITIYSKEKDEDFDGWHLGHLIKKELPQYKVSKCYNVRDYEILLILKNE
jgi:hypothetical protein